MQDVKIQFSVEVALQISACLFTSMHLSQWNRCVREAYSCPEGWCCCNEDRFLGIFFWDACGGRMERCSGLFHTWHGRTSLLLPSACDYRFSELFVWMLYWKTKRQESFLSSHCWHDTTNVHVSSIPENKTFEVYRSTWKQSWTWILNTSKLQLLCVYVYLFTYECIYKYYKKKNVKSTIQFPLLASGIFPLVLIESRIKSKLRKVLQPEL